MSEESEKTVDEDEAEADSESLCAPSSVTDLSSDEKDLLLSQTERVLERHAEVQQRQRKQAIRTLQVYVAGFGVLFTLFPFIQQGLSAIELQETITLAEGVLALLSIVVGSIFLVIVPMAVSDIPLPVAEILTPKPVERGILQAVWNRVRGQNREESRGGGGIQSVSRADDLVENIREADQNLVERILADRLDRIRENETVIEYNSDRLQYIYQSFTLAVESTMVAVLMFLFAFLLVGTI